MVIEIWRLDPEGERFQGEEPASVLDLEGEGEAGPRPAGPVRYDLSASVAGTVLLVKGRLVAPMRFVCSRCGEPFTASVEERAFEHTAEFEDRHTTVNLTPEIRETIILALPNTPVCSESCRGVCPRCGANRNRRTCRCAGTDADVRWAALDGWTKTQERECHGGPKTKKVKE